jgi:hypothetical protein
MVNSRLPVAGRGDNWETGGFRRASESEHGGEAEAALRASLPPIRPNESYSGLGALGFRIGSPTFVRSRVLRNFNSVYSSLSLSMV